MSADHVVAYTVLKSQDCQGHEGGALNDLDSVRAVPMWKPTPEFPSITVACLLTITEP